MKKENGRYGEEESVEVRIFNEPAYEQKNGDALDRKVEEKGKTQKEVEGEEEIEERDTESEEGTERGVWGWRSMSISRRQEVEEQK